MSMQITQGPTLVNPEALDDVAALRAALHRANNDLLTLSQLRHMLEISVQTLGNDLADVAQAFREGREADVLQVAQRIAGRVARCHELAGESARKH